MMENRLREKRFKKIKLMKWKKGENNRKQRPIKRMDYSSIYKCVKKQIY